MLSHGCECDLELAFVAGAENVHLQPEGLGRRLRGSHLDFAVRIVWIHEISDGDNLWHEIAQQLQSFSDRCCTKYGDTGGIAARSIEARYQVIPDRVAVSGEHDGNRLGCRLRYLGRRIADRDDHSH